MLLFCQLSWDDAAEGAGRVVEAFASDVMKPVSHTPMVERFYSELYGSIASAHFDLSTEQVQDKVEDPVVMHFLVWSRIMLYEIYAPSYHPFQDFIDFVYGRSWFESLAVLTVALRGQPLVRPGLPRLLPTLPRLGFHLTLLLPLNLSPRTDKTSRATTHALQALPRTSAQPTKL
ncbi:hypothetical protein [Streptomyces luteogriseus]|uniref:hypothetical protein n=1 Tax=Streptomyces luteogriseus TaxID=68233 RepID=UPI003687271A